VRDGVTAPSWQQTGASWPHLGIRRLDVLAAQSRQAAHEAARRAGRPSTLDQIRVDLLAGLLDEPPPFSEQPVRSVRLVR
jgi:hypothetical protein